MQAECTHLHQATNEYSIARLGDALAPFACRRVFHRVGAGWEYLQYTVTTGLYSGVPRPSATGTALGLTRATLNSLLLYRTTSSIM